MALRLVMLGMWHSHAAGIVRQVVEHPEELRLVGFHDRDPEVVRRRAAAWRPLDPGRRVFDSPDELPREPLDGVVVNGQVYQILKHARMALDTGRPVLLETPAGDNLAEFRRLIGLARGKHLHVQMIYLFRYMAAVQEMLRRARDLGRIYFF